MRCVAIVVDGGWLARPARLDYIHHGESEVRMAVKSHVLVVDDEPDIRASIAEYLGIHGFDVSTADGGAAAWRTIDVRKPVDLVILDVRMPGEDGISIARSL